ARVHGAEHAGVQLDAQADERHHAHAGRQDRPLLQGRRQRHLLPPQEGRAAGAAAADGRAPRDVRARGPAHAVHRAARAGRGGVPAVERGPRPRGRGRAGARGEAGSRGGPDRAGIDVDRRHGDRGPAAGRRAGRDPAAGAGGDQAVGADGRQGGDGHQHRLLVQPAQQRHGAHRAQGRRRECAGGRG
ncbi:hypothetical protein LTR53_018704, partial [Teratosphaeriaceae sp. CCFEE 6253]